MNNARKTELASRLNAVMNQCIEDASSMDGKPFDGKTVAAIFGETLANIYTVAGVLKEVLEDGD